MRRIRVAQLGMNRYSHGIDIFDALKTMPEVFEIAGYTLVEDEEQTCADKLHTFEGYPRLTLEQILTDESIEAVFVETDEIHLTKYAQMVADAGKHMHMEKPGGASLEDFRTLIQTVKENGRVFHVGYMFRYYPFIREVIDRAKAGELGEIYSVQADMSRFDKAPTREWLSTFRGGMMFYLGCHLIDIILQIQGKPTRVLPLNTSTGFDGIGSEDIGFAVLEYPNGLSHVRIAATEVGGSHRRQLVVCGRNMTVDIKPLERRAPDNPYMLQSDKAEYYFGEDGHTKVKTETCDMFLRYEAMLRSFAAMVRGEKTNPYTPDYELMLYETIMTCCNVQ